MIEVVYNYTLKLLWGKSIPHNVIHLLPYPSKTVAWHPKTMPPSSALFFIAVKPE
jgi:hypothetical protein